MQSHTHTHMYTQIHMCALGHTHTHTHTHVHGCLVTSPPPFFLSRSYKCQGRSSGSQSHCRMIQTKRSMHLRTESNKGASNMLLQRQHSPSLLNGYMLPVLRHFYSFSGSVKATTSQRMWHHITNIFECKKSFYLESTHLLIRLNISLSLSIYIYIYIYMLTQPAMKSVFICTCICSPGQ